MISEKKSDTFNVIYQYWKFNFWYRQINWSTHIGISKWITDIMGEVKVWSQNLGPTSYRLTSYWCHVNPPSYS